MLLVVGRIGDWLPWWYAGCTTKVGDSGVFDAMVGDLVKAGCMREAFPDPFGLRNGVCISCDWDVDETVDVKKSNIKYTAGPLFTTKITL